MTELATNVGLGPFASTTYSRNCAARSAYSKRQWPHVPERRTEARWDNTIYVTTVKRFLAN